MIKSSEAYRDAVTAPTRRTELLAVVSIVDPDIVYGSVSASPQASFSKSDQLCNGVTASSARYATLERNRYILDGSLSLIPDDPKDLEGEIGVVSSAISGADGSFSTSKYAQKYFSGVSILQAFSVFFPEDPIDGVAEDFKAQVYQGSTVYYSQSVTGNRLSRVDFSGFEVQNPTRIRVTVTKWSLPGRRMRVLEIVPGVYEEWDGRVLSSFEAIQQGDVSCMSLPYGTASIGVDNTKKRFEPRKKDSLFRSIEERQGISFFLGPRLPGGVAERKPIGVYYQTGDGWKTSDNGSTIKWELADIIGLVRDRMFVAPSTLPTVLSGWVAAVVSVLGVNFAGRYHVDPDYADLPVMANSVEDVTGKTCGDILRWACQATGTWPRADNQTGYLTVEPLWSEGGKITLRQVLSYPTMKANSDIAALIFKLHDDAGTEVTVSGTSASSSDSKTIDNPFIHTRDQALTAARMILSCYGGNKLETVGRGDPSSEIGDVDTVWMDESSATTGRRIQQSFLIRDGVLKSCQSTLLQADGAALYQNCQVITKSGSWTAPAGVTHLLVIIGQGGQGGERGQDGYVRGVHDASNGWDWDVDFGYGEDGRDGSGGKIWYGPIDINDQQVFDVDIGKGGAASLVYGTPGQEGGETSFGPYSSADGAVYVNGFTDVQRGESYGRTGVSLPLTGSSDGGKGGSGGTPGAGEWKYSKVAESPTGVPWYDMWFHATVAPGKGKDGSNGADGFVVVYWDKEEL